MNAHVSFLILETRKVLAAEFLQNYGCKDSKELALCWAALLNLLGLFLPILNITKKQARVLKWVSETYRSCFAKIFEVMTKEAEERKIVNITFSLYGPFPSHLTKFSP